jgi:tetratricopeptide (TPR) repeat protein
MTAGGTTGQRTPTLRGSPTGGFGTVDVARVLGVPATRVRAIVRAGLCQPARRGRAFHFSFQDLVLLRAAQGLLKAAIPPRRVRTALRALARQLPANRPLSGVRIFADGRRVIAQSAGTAWSPESGQALFSFDVDALHRAATVVPVAKRHGRAAAGYWFARGVSLEEEDKTEACAAYRQALALDPNLADAYLNLGRLEHEGGKIEEALQLYREAVQRIPDDPVAHYNLGTALEDQRNLRAAAKHYHIAVELDPDFADAHYNLSRLLERLGQSKRALRHLMVYKRLTEG